MRSTETTNINIFFFVPSKKFGGAEQSALLLAKHLSEKGFQIKIILPHCNNNDLIHRKYTKSGIPIYFHNINFNKGIISRFSLLLFFLKKGVFLSSSRVIVFAPEFIKAFGLLSLLFFLKEKAIISFRCDPSSIVLQRKKPRPLGFFIKRCKIVALTQFMQTNLSKYFGIPQSRIHIIPNAIPRTSPTSSNQLQHTTNFLKHELGIPPSSFLLLFIGRIVKSKGVYPLIEMMKALPSLDKDIFLVFVGKGPDEPHLQRLTHSLPLKNVFFAGWKNNIPNLMKCSDALILPSIAEGIPRVILEAFENKLPVITSDIGSLKEVLKNGQKGTLFKLGTVSAMIETVLWCKRNPQATKKKAERAFIEHQKNDYSKMVNCYISLLNT